VTSPGARLLCDYLEYTDSGGAVPGGTAGSRAGGTAGSGMAGSSTVPGGWATRTGSAGQQGSLSPFEADVAQRLVELGITVVPRYGVGGYRVDFAAAHPAEPGRMVLAIEADGASYADSRSTRDRDRLRKEHLERLGWTFHRIWSTNWFQDPDSDVAKVQEAYREAVARVGPPTMPTTSGADTAGPDTSGPDRASPDTAPATHTASAPDAASVTAPDLGAITAPEPGAITAPDPDAIPAATPGQAIALREPGVTRPWQPRG